MGSTPPQRHCTERNNRPDGNITTERGRKNDETAAGPTQFLRNNWNDPEVRFGPPPPKQSGLYQLMVFRKTSIFGRMRIMQPASPADYIASRLRSPCIDVRIGKMPETPRGSGRDVQRKMPGRSRSTAGRGSGSPE